MLFDKLGPNYYFAVCYMAILARSTLFMQCVKDAKFNTSVVLVFHWPFYVFLPSGRLVVIKLNDV